MIEVFIGCHLCSSVPVFIFFLRHLLNHCLELLQPIWHIKCLLRLYPTSPSTSSINIKYSGELNFFPPPCHLIFVAVMAYLGGNEALAVEWELRGQEGVLEVRSRCPVLHSNRGGSGQMAPGNGYPQSQGYQSQKILFHLILA